MKRSLFVTDKEHIEAAAQAVEEMAQDVRDLASKDIPEFGFHITFGLKAGKRTTKQRNAMEVYFRLLAETLNDAGLDMKRVLREEIDIPWVQASVKEHLWRPIQLALTDKPSTANLERDEVSKIYKVLDKNLGEKLKVHVPFPQNRYPE